MKKLLIMMCVLFIINLVAIIIPLWSSGEHNDYFISHGYIL